MADGQTISVPQLILVLLLGALAIRWLFFSNSSSRASNETSSANNNRVREADVETVQLMFPQVARRSIMWDLMRNGGNVAATTERILNGRGLEVPPPTFQPPLPARNAPLASVTNSKPAISRPAHPDLITRYNLAAKVASGNADGENAEVTSRGGSKQLWSQNKNERQALLQKRREEMILAARRKMLAKVAAESTQGNASAGLSS